MLPKSLQMVFSLEHSEETFEAIRQEFLRGANLTCPLRKAIHHLLLRHINYSIPGPIEGRRD